MKMKTIACAVALASFSVAATADRYIIQTDAANKGQLISALQSSGAALKVKGKNWVAAELDEATIEALPPGLVKKYEADVKRHFLSLYEDDLGDPAVTQLTPYAVYQSEADQLSIGTPKKVCVIDSGIAGGVGETGGKNYDFDWSSITGTSDSGTGNWYEDGGPHGTHVAGTVAATDNDFGVVGMAPGNPMHIIKVFNDDGWGYSSDLAKAAEDCTAAGTDIITMSLGGGGASSVEENAFQTFTDNGGLVLAAAGNDGNDVRSYPAGYKSVMMVGANDADNNIADFSQFPSCTETSGRGKKATTETHDGYCVEVTAGGVQTLSTYPAGGATLSSVSIDGSGVASSAMENTGSASGNTYFMGTAEATDPAASGNICVIDRGNISFYDKVANCEASGGIGAIIVNNVSGMLAGTLGDTNDTTIPAVGAALEDRSVILAGSTASISIEPGDYGYMSGTSMATPAVAGVAALVWSNNPTCTGTDIRDALKSTAEDAGQAGKDVYFGYGIVKAKQANDYILQNGCGGTTTPEPSDFDLTASGYKVKGAGTADLSWVGHSSPVDIYRDGAMIASNIAGGAYTDSTGMKGSFSVTYQVCEVNSNTCSDSETVSF